MALSAPPGRLRRVLGATLAGPGVGALVHTALFAICLLRFGGGEYMGVSDAQVIDRVLAVLGDEVGAMQMALLARYLVVGACAGLVATVHLGVVARLRGRSPFRGSSRVLRVALLVLTYHAWFVGRTLVSHPQVLADAFLGDAEPWRSLQIALTDSVPPQAFDAVVLAYGVFLVGAVLILLERRLPRMSQLLARPWRAYAVIAVVSTLLGVLVALAAIPSRAPQTRNNLLIVAVDSLRPDRMALDDSRPLPALEAFSRRATTFANAWTVMPRTFPSWVSMLTGQYPHEHGIRHMFPSPAQLAQPRETLFTRLREAGYQTAVISDFAGDVFSRIELGFDEVRVPRFTLRDNVRLAAFKMHYHLLPYLLQVPGMQRLHPRLKLWERLADPHSLTDEAVRWLRGRKDHRPFALVVFYSTPHFPYASPYPWYGRYTSPDYDGPSRYHKASWSQTSRAPGVDEQTQIRALYDGALAATDDAIGGLFRALEQDAIASETTVVVTADHGENLYEHGYGVGHGDHLRGSSSLRIPLVIRPRGPLPPGREVHRPVRSTDIAPTLLDLLGRPALAQASGVSLRPLVQGQRVSDPAPPVFFETGLWFISPEAEVLEGRTLRFADGFGAFAHDPETTEVYFQTQYDDDLLVAKHRAVLHDGYKMLYVPTRHGVQWQLFDVRADPDETRDLVNERPEVADRYRQLLLRWMLDDPQMMLLGDYVVPRFDSAPQSGP